jgi:hypothetical protein
MLVEQMQTRGYVPESQNAERIMSLPIEGDLKGSDIQVSDAVLKGGVDG